MKLTNTKRVILQAGHGQGDPGAVWKGAVENTEVNEIIKRLEPMLKAKGVDVVVTPDIGFTQGIAYVNKHYNKDTDWVLEIHKDSAPSMEGRDVKRMGVYHYAGNRWSSDIGEVFKKHWRVEDPQNQHNSWNRPDTAARFGRLGWLRDTVAPSHLIEAGFVQGFTGHESYDYYAKMIAKPILELFGKENYIENNNNTQNNMSHYGWNTNLENNPLFEYYKNKINQNDKSLVSDIADRDDEIKEWREKFETLKAENYQIRKESLQKSTQIEKLENELREVSERLSELENKDYKINEKLEEIKSSAKQDVEEMKSHFQIMLDKINNRKLD